MTAPTAVGTGPWTIEAHEASYRMHRGWRRVDRHARHGRPYERALLERIHGQGFTGTAVDVGANVGNHTLWLAAVCGLQVEAFEPVWPNRLAANIALNGLDGRVAVHPVALGDRDTSAVHVRAGRLIVDACGDIPVRTLDSYGLDDVSVVKVDVEGWEQSVLSGARETLGRCRPVVYAEEHGAQRESVAQVLQPLGYRWVGFVRGERGTPVSEWQPT